MRHSIAYIISAVAHIAVIALLLTVKQAPQENVVVELSDQFAINFQVLEASPQPLPTPTPQLEQKPTPIVKNVKPIKKTIKPTPIKRVQPSPKVPLEENKAEEAKIEKKAPTTNVVAANRQTIVKSNSKTKQPINEKNESTIIHNPTYQKQRPIKYPKSAKRKKLQGTVIIRAAIDASGRVEKAWAHGSSGHPVLDRAAIKSVQRWIFTPAKKGDSFIASTVQFPVVFQLK